MAAAALAVVLPQEPRTSFDLLVRAEREVETSVRPGYHHCWCGAVGIGRAVVGLATEFVPQMRRSALPHSGDIVGLDRSHSQKARSAFLVRPRLV